MDDILFFDGRYRWLSNFYLLGFTRYEGLEYPTTEHAYQAAKFADPEIRKKIRALRTPGQAKQAGQGLAITTPDWENIKVSVMERCLESKFTNVRMSAYLIATKDAYLEEGNTWGDTFWGACDGAGRNELGKALMRRRALLGGHGITISWRDM